MRILGLIPARGGSKGIPGKNIRHLNGLPLLAYTASAAKRSSSLSSVVLSTDDETIAVVGRSCGLEVPFIRPGVLATDTAKSVDVIQHALNFFEEKNLYFDAVCLLQPTYPFREAGLIDACVEKFIKTRSETLFTVQRIPHNYNPHWIFEENSEGFLSIATKDREIIASRQQLPAAFIRDGAVYLITRKLIMQHNTLYGQRISYVETPKRWYANIDTDEDWYRAEEIAPTFLKHHPLSPIK